jgi:hypothetical protein
VTIHLSTGDTFTATASFPTHTFIGLTSSVPITSLDLVITGGNRKDTLAVDNFVFGSATVLEPSSLAFLALGGLGLAGWRRW